MAVHNFSRVFCPLFTFFGLILVTCTGSVEILLLFIERDGFR